MHNDGKTGEILALQDLPDDWQLEQLRAALAFVTDFSLAIDVGAHRGIWTSYLLQHFKKVISIEPTDLADLIDRRAEVVKVAIGSKTGRCMMQNGKHNTGQSHVVPGDGIMMMTLDQLKLAPSFIKIDVEGMELDVLQGAEQTITTYRPVIMLEENGLCQRYGHKDYASCALLEKWGARRVASLFCPPEKDENLVYRFGDKDRS